MTPDEAKEFTKLFSKLNERILATLSAAETMAEANEALGMLGNMAGYDLPQAKTHVWTCAPYEGQALVRYQERLWLKNGADEADASDHDASFSMFQYGLILIDGQLGVPADPITGKYWIDKAAVAGYRPAKKEQRKRWKK